MAIRFAFKIIDGPSKLDLMLAMWDEWPLHGTHPRTVNLFIDGLDLTQEESAIFPELRDQLEKFIAPATTDIDVVITGGDVLERDRRGGWDHDRTHWSLRGRVVFCDGKPDSPVEFTYCTETHSGEGGLLIQKIS